MSAAREEVRTCLSLGLGDYMAPDVDGGGVRQHGFKLQHPQMCRLGSGENFLLAPLLHPRREKNTTVCSCVLEKE